MHEFNKLHPDFDGIRFVSLAISKTLNPESLTFLHIQTDGRTIEASDRHRCHQYTLTNPLKPGLYKVVVNKKTEIIIAPSDCGLTFPNTAKLFPSAISDLQQFENGEYLDLEYARIIRALPCGALQHQYFLDAMSGVMTEFLPGDGFTAVLFRGPNCLAVVMPLGNRKA